MSIQDQFKIEKTKIEGYGTSCPFCEKRLEAQTKGELQNQIGRHLQSTICLRMQTVKLREAREARKA